MGLEWPSTHQCTSPTEPLVGFIGWMKLCFFYSLPSFFFLPYTNLFPFLVFSLSHCFFFPFALLLFLLFLLGCSSLSPYSSSFIFSLLFFLLFLLALLSVSPCYFFLNFFVIFCCLFPCFSSCVLGLSIWSRKGVWRVYVIGTLVWNKKMIWRSKLVVRGWEVWFEAKSQCNVCS